MGYSEQNRAGRQQEPDVPQRADATTPFLRARPITSGRIVSTRSTSARVDSLPSEKRISEFASPLSTPSASTTCEGSNDPAEHAEPLEAQMPSKSSPASNGRLSEPSTTKESVFVSRRSRDPTNCTPGRWSTRRSSRSVSGASRIAVENWMANKTFQGHDEPSNTR